MGLDQAMEGGGLFQMTVGQGCHCCVQAWPAQLLQLCQALEAAAGHSAQLLTLLLLQHYPLLLLLLWRQLLLLLLCCLLLPLPQRPLLHAWVPCPAALK